VTTATFNTPANALVVAIANSKTAAAENITMTIQDNKSQTWNAINERDPGDASSQNGHVSAWYALVSSAQTGMTVTATQNSSQNGISLKVYVITGHNTTSPIGNVGEGSSTTNNISPTAYTASVTGSVGFGGGTDMNILGVPTSTDNADTVSNATLSALSLAKAASSTSGSAVIMNFDAFGSNAAAWNWIGFEIKPQPPSSGGGGGGGSP